MTWGQGGEDSSILVVLPARAHRLRTPEEEEARAEVAVVMAAHSLSSRLKEAPGRTQAGDAPVAAEGGRNSILRVTVVEARPVELAPDR